MSHLAGFGEDPITIGIVIEDLNASGAPWAYIKTLAKKLFRSGAVEPVVIYRRGDTNQFDDEIRMMKLADRPYPTRWLPDRPLPARLATVEALEEIDIFHLNKIPDVGHLFALEADAPVIATVHGTLHWEDLPIQVQNRSYRLRRRFFDRLGRFTLDRVLTVSDYVSRTLIDKAGYPPEQVTTTYEAIDDIFFTLPKSEGIEGVPEDYILHVSNAAPKKNIETLLAAFRRLRMSGTDVELLVAGDRWHPKGPRLAATYGVDEYVEFLGYVSQERLVRLYDEAMCFVYPSYHETFGLPNVEAMARGTPVVTTSAYAIPEIVDNAAVLIDNPGDPDELADAIDSTIENIELRKGLINQGSERSRMFQWKSHCDLLLDKYQGVYHSPHRS